MTAGLLTLGILAAGTYVLKAAGPLLLGRHQLSQPVERIVTLLPAALLAALVVTSTVTVDGRIVADARLLALLVAALLLWRRAPFVVVVLGAAATAALIRALT